MLDYLIGFFTKTPTEEQSLELRLFLNEFISDRINCNIVVDYATGHRLSINTGFFNAVLNERRPRLKQIGLEFQNLEGESESDVLTLLEQSLVNKDVNVLMFIRNLVRDACDQRRRTTDIYGHLEDIRFEINPQSNINFSLPRVESLPLPPETFSQNSFPSSRDSFQNAFRDLFHSVGTVQSLYVPTSLRDQSVSSDSDAASNRSSAFGRFSQNNPDEIAPQDVRNYNPAVIWNVTGGCLLFIGLLLLIYTVAALGSAYAAACITMGVACIVTGGIAVYIAFEQTKIPGQDR